MQHAALFLAAEVGSILITEFNEMASVEASARRVRVSISKHVGLTPTALDGTPRSIAGSDESSELAVSPHQSRSEAANNL
jgi:hypothetical protein